MARGLTWLLTVVAGSAIGIAGAVSLANSMLQ